MKKLAIIILLSFFAFVGNVVAQTHEDFSLASVTSVDGYETLKFVANAPVSAHTIYELSWEVEGQNTVCVIVEHGNLMPGETMSITLRTMSSRDKGISYALLKKPNINNPGGMTVEKGMIQAYNDTGMG